MTTYVEDLPVVESGTQTEPAPRNMMVHVKACLPSDLPVGAAGRIDVKVYHPSEVGHTFDMHRTLVLDEWSKTDSGSGGGSWDTVFVPVPSGHVAELFVHGDVHVYHFELLDVSA